jgi:hypothetical protein
LDVRETGNLEVQVGYGSTVSTVVLTPRAAIQVQHELGVMIQKIKEIAAQVPRPQPETL